MRRAANSHGIPWDGDHPFPTPATAATATAAGAAAAEDDRWRAALGSRDHALTFRAHFAQWLRALGGSRTALLRAALPTLLPGMAKGLFHPVIRASFALMHGSGTRDDDVATGADVVDALAYFAMRYEELYAGAHDDFHAFVAAVPATTSTATAATAAAAAAGAAPAAPAASSKATGGGSLWDAFARAASHPLPAGATRHNTFGTVAQLVADPAFRARLRGLGKGETTDALLLPATVAHADTTVTRLRELCAAAVRLYVHTPALTTLHAVTGLQALIDLFPFVDGVGARNGLVWLYTVWLAALWREKGAPDVVPEHGVAFVVPRGVAWDELSARATRAKDTHTIKLVLSLRVLHHKVVADPVFLYAANSVVERNRPW